MKTHLAAIFLAGLCLALCGCKLLHWGDDTLVVGLHESVGVVNPLERPNRPSLAAQQLQLPALIEFLGRTTREGRTHNQYRLSLVDTAQGSINWNYKRRGGIFAKFKLGKGRWYDPRTGGTYPITAFDVQATIERIKKASEAARLAHQRGRLPPDPFANFVAEAIESIEVDQRNPRILYIRFGDHILGPNRMHALTFRVLPRDLLTELSDDEDVFVSATSYVWANWNESGGPSKAPDAVLHFKSRPDAPPGSVAQISLETKQDLRSYKIQLESGAYGMAYGLPQTPGVDLDLPEHIAWKAYRSADVWTLVLNCKRLAREERRSLLAIVGRPERIKILAELVRASYPDAGGDLLRRSVFPAHLVDRYPRVREAIERQAARSLAPLERAQRNLRGREFRLIYSYGMGDQFEPDIIAATIREPLEEASIALVEDRLEYRDFLAELESGHDFDLALYKFGGAAQLPEDFDLAQILPMVEERRAGGDDYAIKPAPHNYFHFAHLALFEALLELRLYPSENEYGEIDPGQLQRRQEALVAIDRIVREEAIGLFLFSPAYHWFWDDRFDLAFDESKIIGGKNLPRYRN